VKILKVYLEFDAQFVGNNSIVIDMPDDATDEDIIKQFETILDIPFDENCRFYKNVGIIPLDSIPKDNEIRKYLLF